MGGGDDLSYVHIIRDSNRISLEFIISINKYKKWALKDNPFLKIKHIIIVVGIEMITYLGKK